MLLPRVSVALLPRGDVDGRGALIRHFHRHLGLDGLVRAAGLLEDSALLVRAERVHAMATVWGDLEEELSSELVRPRLSPVLAEA